MYTIQRNNQVCQWFNINVEVISGFISTNSDRLNLVHSVTLFRPHFSKRVEGILENLCTENVGDAFILTGKVEAGHPPLLLPVAQRVSVVLAQLKCKSCLNWFVVLFVWQFRFALISMVFHILPSCYRIHWRWAVVFRSSIHPIACAMNFCSSIFAFHVFTFASPDSRHPDASNAWTVHHTIESMSTPTVRDDEDNKNQMRLVESERVLPAPTSTGATFSVSLDGWNMNHRLRCNA